MTSSSHSQDFTHFDEDKRNPEELLEEARDCEFTVQQDWDLLNRRPQVTVACQLTMCGIRAGELRASQLRAAARGDTGRAGLRASEGRRVHALHQQYSDAGGETTQAALHNFESIAAALAELKAAADSAALAVEIEHEPGSDGHKAAVDLHASLVAAMRRPHDVDAQGRRYLQVYAAAHCEDLLREVDPDHHLLTHADPSATPVSSPLDGLPAEEAQKQLRMRFLERDERAKERNRVRRRQGLETPRPRRTSLLSHVVRNVDSLGSAGAAGAAGEGAFRRGLLYFGRAY